MDQSLIFDLELIKRYDKSGPRYTSYPTAVQFHTGFGEAEYRQVAQATNSEAQPRPLSLYFHIPFCDTVCFYCACNKIATKDRSKAQPYLNRVYKELAMQSKLFDRSRPVDQLHWGGGTPTFISHEQMQELMHKTRESFTLRDDDSGEYSIEIDPREASPETITLLRQLGFNRLSLGVQDFDTAVQEAVNRLQTEEETFAVLQEARRTGFRSISIDLIYGLPLQTLKGFGKTLDRVLAQSPDRLSVFNYAHLPEMFKPQRRINVEELPSAAEKLEILQMASEKLAAAGYVYIGMDHFAKPEDELAVAQRNGQLYRNFQGYSTHADCDLIGFGVTSVGKVGNSYSQNVRTLEEYYHSIDQGRLPVFRGIALDNDDLLRREVITQLICNFELDKQAIAKKYNVDFDEYFTDAATDLQQMQTDGLIKVDARSIHVQPGGRLLIRNICMAFDKYLRQATEQRFSKVI
ncbi:MAG: oxygen-independent coproporphyrinogen III oxidase [Gammaproteobacteria bacterium]|nr:oxygen-independent coproporphyrinogen III oxidase [Gammaproteobacteria bacterium]